MSEKITKAMNDGAARANAVEKLGLGQYAKVSNTEYALTVKDLEGNDKIVVVKLTVTKAQTPIDDMVAKYEADRAEVEARKAEREAERAAKKAEKESKKAEKENIDEEIEF